MTQIKEVRSLTGLRGVAAVYVVLHHYAQGISPTNAPKILLDHGYLAVDLFFVLSGFVMALNYAGLFEHGWSANAFYTFLGRRIARVYPLYLACTLCALFFILIGAPGWFSTQPLIFAIPLNLTMIQAWGFGNSLDGPGWSISAEWAAYLLFPAILWLAYKGSALRTRIATALSIIALALLCAFRSSILHEQSFAILEFHSYHDGVAVLHCLPEFLLGIVAAKTLRQGDQPWPCGRRYATEAICVCILVLACIVRTDLLIVLLFPFLILCLSRDASLPNRILSGRICHHLGLLSYSIYLVHDLLAGLMGSIHRWVDAHGMSHGQTYAAAVALPLTYVAALGAYRYIEKPSRQVLRSFFERDKPAVALRQPASTLQ